MNFSSKSFNNSNTNDINNYNKDNNFNDINNNTFNFSPYNTNNNNNNNNNNINNNLYNSNTSLSKNINNNNNNNHSSNQFSKIEVRVKFNNDFYSVLVSIDSLLSKLLKIIEAYYSDDLFTINNNNNIKSYSLITIIENIDLMNYNNNMSLLNIINSNNNLLQNITDQQYQNPNSMPLLELVLNIKSNNTNDNNNNNITNTTLLSFTCTFKSTSKTFTLESNSSFEKLKFNILAVFPELENANYTIESESLDLTTIFPDNKILHHIFKTKNEILVNNYNGNIIFITINIKPKHFVKYLKKCSVCFIVIAERICVDCCKAYCDNCYYNDEHSSKRINGNNGNVNSNGNKHIHTIINENTKNVSSIRIDENKNNKNTNTNNNVKTNTHDSNIKPNELDVEILITRLQKLKLYSKNILSDITNNLINNPQLSDLKKELTRIVNKEPINKPISNNNTDTTTNTNSSPKLQILQTFTTLESTTLKQFLLFLTNLKHINTQHNLQSFPKQSHQNHNSLLQKQSQNTELLNTLNIYQQKQLLQLTKKILSIINPEKTETIINKIFSRIKNYSQEKFFDCEEAMMQVNFFYIEISELFERFDYCLFLVHEYNKQFEFTEKINNEVTLFLEKMIGKCKGFSFGNEVVFNSVVKIFDDQRVVVFDYCERSEEKEDLVLGGLSDNNENNDNGVDGVDEFNSDDTNIRSDRNEFAIRNSNIIDRSGIGHINNNNHNNNNSLNKPIIDKSNNTNTKYKADRSTNRTVSNYIKNRYGCIKINNLLNNNNNNTNTYNFIKEYSQFNNNNPKILELLKRNSHILEPDVNSNTNKGVLYNTNFSLLQFHDNASLFKRNYNNYVQVNLNKHLFVVTGSNSNKLFFYNLVSNEMKFVNNLSFSHNWWPSLLVISTGKRYNSNSNNIINKTENKEGNNNTNKLSVIHELTLLCLSGTYTSKCEALDFKIEVYEHHYNQITESINSNSNIINKLSNTDILTYISQLSKFDIDISPNWRNIPDILTNRGQASSIVINNTVVYLFFGYNYKQESITTIEKYDNNNWEKVAYTNTSDISALLYYHANLLSHKRNVITNTKTINNSNTNTNTKDLSIIDSEVLIFGGLKEIDSLDNIYSYDLEKNELSKTKLMNSDFYQFQNEKCFVDISISNNNYNYENDNNNINRKSRVLKEINEEAICNNKGNKTFALFDNSNNVHIYKEKKGEYKVIKFSV